MQISGSGNSAMLQQMQAMRRQMFLKADADQSGGLSLDEFKTAGQNMPVGAQGAKGTPNAEKAFAKIDTNGDGKLSSDEMSAFRPKFDIGSMNALLKAQEAGSNTETDPATTLLNILNGQDSSEAASSRATGNDDLVSQLMDILNASSEKSTTAKSASNGNAEGSSMNLDNLKAQLTKDYTSMASASGSTLSLAA